MKGDFLECLRNFRFSICLSVDSYERNFSKLKLIKTILGTTKRTDFSI